MDTNNGYVRLRFRTRVTIMLRRGAERTHTIHY